METKINELFSVHMLNAQGKMKATQIAADFTTLLAQLEAVCPPGRELSIVRTHLQDACFYAKRAMAMKPENQEK